MNAGYNISDSQTVDILCSLKHRAEKSDDLSAFFPSFVPVVDINHLKNPNTQVIFGRNGTGKTHFFKCFEEVVKYSFDHHDVIPLYFDMRALNISRVSPDLTEEDLVEIFFKSFLYDLVEKLNAFNTFILNYNGIGASRESRIKSKSSQSKFHAGIKRLRKAFDNNRMREKIDNYTKTIKENRQSSTKASVSGELSDSPKLSVSGGADASNEREEFIEITVQASHFIDYEEIKIGFEEIAEAFEANQIVILIDEWSQIDTELQPVISELIRRTLCTSNKISLKFAALKFLTKFSGKSRGRRIGLQPGIDITELTDLNQIFTFDLDRKAVRQFLIFILVKHILEAIGRDVLKYDFEDPTKLIWASVDGIFSRLFEHIFESREAFDHFVRASEGNPRDFLAMISECCATHGAAQLPIGMKAVRASAINYFKTTKMANFSSDHKGAAILFEKIFSRCLKNKSKIFSVSKKLDQQSKELQDLWSQRIVHLIDNNYEYFHSETGEIHSSSIYAVDYGKILGLRSDKNGAKNLDGIIQEASHVISGLYDGSTHQTILENIETEDNNLAAVSQIIGSSPDNNDVTDPSDVMSETVLFEKINQINIDDIIAGHQIQFSDENINN